MIRVATLGDAEAIARAHVQAWEETYRGKLPDHALDDMTYAIRVAQWTQSLRDPHFWTFVHETNGGIDGFASANRTAEEPGFSVLLSTLYVVRSAHRRGIARALLHAIAGALLEEGIERMWLLTLRDENPARDFYERLGAAFLREQPAPIALGRGTMDVVYAFADLRSLSA